MVLKSARTGPDAADGARESGGIAPDAGAARTTR